MTQRDIGTLRTRLSWEDEGANNSLSGFKRDLKGLRSEMNLAKSGGKEYSNSLKGMREQSDILSRRFKTQEERVKELRKRYDESVKVKGEDAVATKDLQAQLNNAAAEMNRTEEQLKSLNEEIRRQESPWTQLGEKMTSTGEKMQDFGRGMTDFGKSYSMRVTAPIIAGGVAMFKAASDYESAFAGVRKTVDMTEEEYAKLSRGIRDMALEIPAAATEIARVGEAAGQLGIENDHILTFTRTMIDLGVATDMSSDQAAMSLARLANITGMTQTDFDRLGATLVDLGNNFAATEGEISEMAMRIAGAGTQINMSEADILGFSAALASVGIRAEAGGTAISKLMIEMASDVDQGGDRLKEFARIAGMSVSDFRKAFEEDAATAIFTFLGGLGDLSEQGESAFKIIDDLGLSEIRLRDTILRSSSAREMANDALKTANSAWKENTALTEEAEERYKTTESQLIMLWNRLKDVSITLGEALIPAVMGAIDAAEPLIRKIEEGAQAFSEMDEEQQRTILKLVGLVAAVGPAAIVMGNLTTAIGGVLKVGGGFATMLGKAGGSGLLGRVGLLGVAGSTPVGLAIAGVGTLAFGIHALLKESSDLHDVNWDLVESMNAEVTATDELIGRFEELESKNRLTKEEMLRYMDILDQLKEAKSEEAIKKLTDEQNELLKKSGFTNDEMNEFLGLNDKIIEQAPNTVQAISDEGNAFAENLDALKALNEEKRRELLITAERELEKALENEAQLLRDQLELEKEIASVDQELTQNRQRRTEISGELNNAESNLKSIQEEILALEQDGSAEANLKLISLQAQEREAAQIVQDLIAENEHLDKTYDTLVEKLKAKGNDLQLTRDEIKEIDNLKGDYEELILAQAGITAEKGNGLNKINEELVKNKLRKKDLDEMYAKGQILTDEYHDQNNELSTQRERLETAKGRLEEINVLAGQTVYDKEIKTKTTTDSTYRSLGSAVTKTVRLSVAGAGALGGAVAGIGGARAYAAGTKDNPGGITMVGETA